MLKRHVISRDIREFLDEHITSVSMLEALLLMHKTTGENWTADTLARRLYLNRDVGEQVVAQLSDAGFCALVAPAPPTYRYLPSGDGQRLLIDRLAATYEKNLIGLTNLIHSHSPREATLEARRLDALFRRREDTQRYC
jgi:hypothetical protein